jgi:glyoxylase-like metal-dependent hydrolase (beta-lactamase superfamily II)
MLRTLCIASTLALAALPAAAQQDEVTIETQHVAGSVHMLVGQGGNIGVSAGDDGLLIVDDQFARLADKIKAALTAIDKGDLEFVLNTHWHGDHTGGNEIFGLEALIVAHDNVRQRLSTEQTIRGQTTPPAPPQALPVITFDESLSIHYNGEQIHLTHAPAGHTDGDSLIYFSESNVLHMGDQFFSGRFPFVDLGSGGTVQGMAANVKRALDTFPANVKIIPGHGPLSTRADLEKYHRMLEHSIATVQKGIDAGNSLEEIQAAGLADEWDGWGSGFINNEVWIQTVHGSLSQ